MAKSLLTPKIRAGRLMVEFVMPPGVGVGENYDNVLFDIIYNNEGGVFD